MFCHKKSISMPFVHKTVPIAMGNLPKYCDVMQT